MITLFALLSLLFASPPEVCNPIHALVGGELVAWAGYDHGGWNLPSDIKITDRIDFADGGLWEFRAKSDPAHRWLLVMLSYEQTADANGDHFGAHELCGMYQLET